MMEERLRIEIHQSDLFFTAGMTCAMLGLFLVLAGVLYAPTLWGVLLFVAALAGWIAAAHLYEKRPTVIWSDGKVLRWHHLCGTRALALSAVTGMRCEPYTVRTRYGAYQRIRLTLRTNDDRLGDVEFNDSVETSALLQEKLSGIPTEVPLMTLYAYLKAHGCPS
ncbi:MAG: hypothetical protein IJ055_02330 [Oscillospiraceae bacterium]|nr:hypothetical protein [Oscillospiraceae bacterium]